MDINKTIEAVDIQNVVKGMLWMKKVKQYYANG